MTGTRKTNHSATMSPNVQPLPQCSAPLATITGKGVSFLLGIASWRAMAALARASSASRP